MDEIVAFKKSEEIYYKLAEKNLEEGKLEKALGLLFSALSINKNSYETFGKIAEVYSEMGQFDRAIEYWFRYLNKAPEDKQSIAFEELAVNFFYQDKLYEAGYYFHKKILKDGFVTREGLGEEIEDLLLGSEKSDRRAYHIAYPFDKADYKYELELAKKAFNLGDYKKAVSIYDRVPFECTDEESFGDLAVSHFLEGEEEEAIEACRQSLKINGENVTAYCNLCTNYHNKGDYDKSAYYYKKALSLFDRGKEQSYLVASCAIEQNDHMTANFCLEKIISERPYDILMRVYYGISFLNSGDYESAKEQFDTGLRLNPFDREVKYLSDLASRLIDKCAKAGEFLPLKYQKEYPEKVIKAFRKIISDLITEKVQLKTLKKQENIDAVLWGLTGPDELINKQCAVILWFADCVNGKKILTDNLLKIDVRSSVKRVIIYTLMIFGFTPKFSVMAGARFKKIKRPKLLCDGVAGGEKFVSAYATVIARASFWEIEQDDKFSKSVDRIYKNHKEIIEKLDVTIEELSVVLICESKIKELSNHRELCSFFGANEKRVKEILSNMGENKK